MKKNDSLRELVYLSLKKSVLILHAAVVLLILGIAQAHAIGYYVDGNNLLTPEYLNRETDIYGTTQQITVTGTITDSQTGEPMPGVNIVVKGTTMGAITEADGKYSLSVSDRNVTLIFSFVGYIAQEIPLNGRTTLNVALAGELKGLEEVVVIGYGTVKKSDLTGSISSVRSEDLILGAVSAVDQALLGRAAGVYITQTSSEPGGGLSIRVRGASSITAGNEPLYVIDGLPINNTPTVSLSGYGTGGNANPKNPLNSLNPNDIKSIEILKDASATAIYGSRGANGVVLITTKRGQTSGANFNYDVYTGMQTVAKKLDVLTTQEYINALNAISVDNGKSPIFSDSDISAIGEGTDWQDEIFRPAMIQSHNLSLQGKNQNTSYFASVNYFDQQGIIKKTSMDKYIVRLNLEQEVFKRLTLSLNMNASLVNDDVGDNGTATNQSSGSVNSAIQYDPTLPIFNEDGTYLISSELLLNNPVALVDGTSNLINTMRLFGNFSLNYKIIEGLSAKINLGTDQQRARRDIYSARVTVNGIANNGLASILTAENSNTLAEGTLPYIKNLTQNHIFEAVTGVTYENFNRRTASSNARDFPTDALSTNSLAFANPLYVTVASYKGRNSLLSYFGRVNLSLFDQFVLTGSIRADGSSRFGENNKFGYFPSGAFAWKLTKLSFIPKLFDELKFRSSWGITGNQEIGNYASLTTYSISTKVHLGGSLYNATRPTRVANPDLKWESTEQFNIGLDVSIFKSRLTGTFDYYVKNTRDMLINFPLPPSSGFSSTMRNIGRMRDKGFETLLKSNNFVGKDFSWNTTLIFAATKNEVKDIGELDAILLAEIWKTGNTVIIKPGLPLCSYYGYRITGIFQTPEQVTSSAQPSSKPGWPIFEDVNKDKKISTADQVVLGSPIPDFTFGIGNTLNYKNLGLDLFFQGQYGNKLLNVNAIDAMYAENFRRNRLANQIKNRWTPENTDAKWPSATDPSNYGGGRCSNLTVEDASYIRLKNLQLSYILPTSRINFISMAKIYLTGQNVFTLTKYSGFDPDANAYGQSIYRIDYNAYPLARTWIVGLNVNF